MERHVKESGGAELVGDPVLVDCPSPCVIPDAPDAWIFHYTNVETLRKILENRTLRFSRVDVMDDAQEAKAFPGELAKKFYASCWTTQDSEGPGEWRSFYTRRDEDQSQRVRIAIRRKPFLYRLQGVRSQDGRLNLLDPSMAKPFQFQDMHSDEYSVSAMNMTLEAWFGRQVSYVDEIEQFYRERIRVDSSGGLTLERVQDFATHKEKAWRFQSEYRFVLMAGPRIWGAGVDDLSSMGTGETLTRILGEADAIKTCRFPANEFIDMPLNMEAIADMKVLLGPLFDPAKVCEVKEFVRACCPAAEVCVSKFTGKMVL